MPGKNRISPIVNWRFREAQGEAPALALGMGTAWPSSKASGQAYSLTAARALGKDFSGYVAASYAPDANLWFAPAGLQYRLNRDWSTKVMWDGDRLHPVVTHHAEQWSLSFLLLDGRDPTLSFSVGF